MLCEVCACFSAFETVSVDTVLRVLQSSPTKHCHLDPMPTWLLEKCAILLTPYIARIINVSLSTGIFPHSWKQAIVTPLLKKQDWITPPRPTSVRFLTCPSYPKHWSEWHYQVICQSTTYFLHSSLLTGIFIPLRRHFWKFSLTLQLLSTLANLHFFPSSTSALLLTLSIMTFSLKG